MSSFNYLGGGGRHTDQYRFFNHAPELKPWRRQPSSTAVAIVKRYMGEGYPVETCEADIMNRIEKFAGLGVEAGLAAYLESVGRRGRVMLAAIRRNFTRHPERWAALGGA